MQYRWDLDVYYHKNSKNKKQKYDKGVGMKKAQKQAFTMEEYFNLYTHSYIPQAIIMYTVQNITMVIQGRQTGSQVWPDHFSSWLALEKRPKMGSKFYVVYFMQQAINFRMHTVSRLASVGAE